jgi:hypothetical protein
MTRSKPRRTTKPVKKTEVSQEPVEVVPAPVEQQPVPEPDGRMLDLSGVRIGYIVAVTKEGKFLFEVLGQDPGLIELLGVHAHAKAKVESMYDLAQGRGEGLLHQLGEAVFLLNKKLDNLLKVILPKKPDNQL